MKIKIGLVGAGGRMGRNVQSLIKKAPYNKKYSLVWKAPGRNQLWPLKFSVKPDVVIDFSLPEGSLRAATLCGVHKIPLLVCVTGLSTKENNQIKKFMGKTPWLHTPNTSLGVRAFHHIIASAAQVLPADYSVELIDIHHILKKDKPSGTAKALATSFESHRKAKPKNKPLKISAFRKGQVIGTHSLLIKGPQEEILLTHKALHRGLFAHGALELASGLLTKQVRKPKRR